MPTQTAHIGLPYNQLETPALLVDLPAMEHNLQRVATFFAGVSVTLRPHVKNHRTPALAKMQLAAGAVGICCGNVAEAEVMINAGIDDVLITKEIVQPTQITRVAKLARRSAVKVIADDAEVVRQLDQAAQKAGTRIAVLVDVDVRLGRSGVAPGEPARQLAQQITQSRGLRFLGIMGYEGSMQTLDEHQREQECQRALAMLIDTKELIERAGLGVPIVSAGAASTYRMTGAFPGVTEVQAGAYLLGDGRYRRAMPEFACALSVLATVISRPSPTRVTIDAGQKKISADGGLPEVTTPDLQVIALNEEHGLLELRAGGSTIGVGDTITLIPQHGSTTINLYDRMYGIRDGRVAEVWEISARGL